jgi:Phage tail tube protein
VAIPSGLAAQLGVVAETAYGTAVTVNRFYPFVDESLTQEIDRLESDGIIAGARVIRSEQWTPGRSTIEGDIGLELYQQFTGLLFEHMLGSITSSTAGGVSTHTVTPGSLTGKSLTVQVGKPDVTGTVQPFTYAGVKIASWELAAEVGEIVTLGLSCIAQTETTGITLATASYGTNAGRPFVYTQGSVSISGSGVCVRGLTVQGENNLDTDRECVGQAFINEPLEKDLREYTGTATLEFSGLTQYQRFVGGLEAPIVLSLSASATAQATLTMNARFDGVSPTVSDKGLLIMDVPFKCVASTTQDSSAISLTLKNVQTSP